MGRIIHKGGFYGLYAALMGDIQTVIFLCIFSIIIIQTVYTTQQHTPSTRRRRRQYYISINQNKKNTYTQKDKFHVYRYYIIYYI